MLFKRIKDWATSITSFRTGDVIPVDGPSGTAKMSKDDLLKETAKIIGKSVMSLSFSGNDETYVYFDITENVILGQKYRIIPSKLNWTVAQNTKSYSYNGFVLYYIDDSDVEHDIAQIQIQSGASAFDKPLDSEYILELPSSGVKNVRVGMRGAVGETLSVDVCLIEEKAETKESNLLVKLINSEVGKSWWAKTVAYNGTKGLYKFTITSSGDNPTDNVNGMYFRIQNPDTGTYSEIIPRGSEQWEAEFVADFDFTSVELKFAAITAAVPYIINIYKESNVDFDLLNYHKIETEEQDIQDLEDIVRTGRTDNLSVALTSGAVGHAWWAVDKDYVGTKGLYKFTVTATGDNPTDDYNGMYLRLHNADANTWKDIIPAHSESWEVEYLADFNIDMVEIKFVMVTVATTYAIAVNHESITDFCFSNRKEIVRVEGRLDTIKQVSTSASIAGADETYVEVDVTDKIAKGATYRLVPSDTNWSVAQNTKAYAYYGFLVKYIKNGVSTHLASIQIESGASQLKTPLDSEYSIAVPLDADSVQIGIRAAVGTTITFAMVISSARSTDITDMYPGEEFIPKLGTLKKMTPSGYSTKNTPVTLLWFSDIHGDVNNVRRIAAFKKFYDQFIDDVLNTGDSVSDNLGNYSDYEAMLSAGADKFLVAVGNHDVTSVNYTSYKGWSGNTAISDIYDKFVGEMDVSGVTLAGANKNYYYKDYTAGAVSTKGLRLIVLDSCIQVSALTQSGSGVSPTDTETYIAEQLSWLESTLADALTNNLAVLIATHGIQAGTEIQSDLGFTAIADVNVDNACVMGEDFLDAVDSFIGDGGEFVCWLGGHKHCDHIAGVSGHPNQMQILVNTATSRLFDAMQCEPYRTGYNGRAPITKTTDAFNVVGIDTYYHRIKIVRVGCNYDAYGRVLDMITIDYSNKQIIR